MNNIVLKGWGYEKILVNNDKYCGKILHLNAGKKLSWHKHNIKDETFWLQKGLVTLIYGDSEDISLAKEILLKPEDSFYVYPSLCHQLIAHAESDIIEISTTHIEEDSIRIIKGD